MSNKLVKVGDSVQLKDTPRQFSKVKKNRTYKVLKIQENTGYYDGSSFITEMEDIEGNTIQLKMFENFFDIVHAAENVTIKKFSVGDKVKIQQDMWEKHQAMLTRLGFSAPNSFHGYEVSQVFENQKRISLKGCSNIYNSEYFELCAEEQSTEMAFKPESNTPQDIQGIHTSALDKQVSGNHYKDCGIQPIEYIHANGLNYFEGNAVKYITRHRKKNGKADIEKAIHYLELMIELEYPK